MHSFLLTASLLLCLSALSSASSWRSEAGQAETADKRADDDLVDIVVPAQILNKRSRARMCGQQLVNAIRMSCHIKSLRGKRAAKYGASSPFPASSPLLSGLDPLTSFYGPEVLMADPWTPNEMLGQEVLAGGLGANVNRFRTVSMLKGLQKRGAADECCAKPCTLTHLETYCHN